MPHRPSRHLHRHQRDLFEPDKPPVILDPAERLTLLPLVKALLAETLKAPHPTSLEEAGDDQAHS